MAENSILELRNNDGSSYPTLYATVLKNTNVQPGNALQKLTGAAVLAGASAGGFPQVAQLGQSLVGESENYDISTTYHTIPFLNLNRLPGMKFQDFRSRKGPVLSIDTSFNPTQGFTGGGGINVENAIAKRLDGTSAATNGSVQSILYASLNAVPGGPYSVFNREADKHFGAGWGDHDNPYALRLDFTAQSNVVTKWDDVKGWIPKLNPLAIATPFRGDRVQVIDFGQRTLKDIYKWKPSILGLPLPGILGKTQDFIKFFLTGPALAPGSTDDTEDDVIVFRATFDSLTDSFNPSWQPQQMIGRADPAYNYTGYGRSIELSFTVYATDRDEMKPIWRKLNALAGYTAPDYLTSNIAMRAPWMRITIGDLYYQQPAIINSLSYTLQSTDTTWEINIENDPEMRELPKKVDVQMSLYLITDTLPQKGGRFYSLNETTEYDKRGKPTRKTSNWLSDAKSNSITTSIIAEPVDQNPIS